MAWNLVNRVPCPELTNLLPGSQMQSFAVPCFEQKQCPLPHIVITTKLLLMSLGLENSP